MPHEAPTIPETVATDVIPGDDIVVNRLQDVEPILENCKALVSANQYRTPSGDMHHLADFPIVIVEKYMNDKGVTLEQVINEPEHIKAMLADPALSYFLISKNITHRVFR